MTEKNPLLWGPRLVSRSFHDAQRDIQVSAHLVHSKAFLREHAVMELVRLGTEVEQEKDYLLEVFADFAKDLCARINQLGYWSDYIDPCSGLPMLSDGCNIVYNEVQSAQQLLGYSVMNASCCKVLLHPDWGSAVYPASIVCTAPYDLVIALLDSFSPS